MTPADFLIRYPEFQAVDEALITVQLDEGAGYLSASAFGVRYDKAVALYAAHELALAGFGGGTDAVSTQAASLRDAGVASFRSGEVSLNLSTGTDASAATARFPGTKYGRALDALFAALPPAIMVV